MIRHNLFDTMKAALLMKRMMTLLIAMTVCLWITNTSLAQYSFSQSREYIVSDVQPSAELPPMLTYSQARNEVSKTHKPLLILITASWCNPCNQLKNVVLPQVASRGGLEGITIASVDLNADKALVKRLTKDTKVPQMILFQVQDDQKWHPTKRIGLMSVDQTMTFLSPAKTAMGTDITVSGVSGANLTSRPQNNTIRPENNMKRTR